MSHYDNIYQIKQTITLSQRLVKDKPEFALYTGASAEISSLIALINTMIKTKRISDPKTIETLEFFKEYLVEQNKALFASIVSELSKLSFYYGLKDDSIHAT